MTGPKRFRFLNLVLAAVLAFGASTTYGEKPTATAKSPLPGAVPKGEFAILPGQTINESLGPGDEEFQDGTFYDQFNLNWPGGDLVITYDSNAFDEYLIVWEPPGFPDGVRVDVDEFVTSPEVYRRNNAPAGNYTIWTNSFDPATGAYTISVNPSSVEPPCPTPAAPGNPSPANQAAGVPIDVDLLWSAKSVDPKVIYGPDDRLDMYQVTDENLLNVARSTVVILSQSDIVQNSDGTFTVASNPTFTDYVEGEFGAPLCENERYRLQPAPGLCSGFLVGRDLVITAGHCIDDQSECDSRFFVFGFEMMDANTPRLNFNPSDVYQCSEIVGRVFTNDGPDWSLVRLDRPVVGRDPLPIRRSGKIADNQSLIIVGHPVGMPKKVAGNANVRTNSASTFFTANLDSYTANSGSAVVNAQTLQVEGVLVRGNADFQMNGACYESIRCSDSGCQGEDCTRTTEFAHLIPHVESQTYSVFFGPCGDLALLGEAANPEWDLPQLQPGLTYCWQIRTKNSCGEETEGPIWTFTTEGQQSTPTFTPTPTDPGATPIPTAFNPAADVDGSGFIDANDMLLILRNWHRRVLN